MKEENPMLIYIECLSCRELWPGDAILDAVDGSLPQPTSA